MNQRDLSEKLEQLAIKLERDLEEYDPELQNVREVAKELRQLSNENYAPGNGVTWTDIKPKDAKKTFTNKAGKKLPF